MFPSSMFKISSASFAAVRRVVVPSSSKSISSPNIRMTLLDQCEEEFDQTVREAHFAFRTVDLKSWESSSMQNTQVETCDDPYNIQHWALVVHFPRGNKTYLFETWNDDETGILIAGRGEAEDDAIFKDAEYFGSLQTSPAHLLQCAKNVDGLGRRYSAISLVRRDAVNNCQTFFWKLLRGISLELPSKFMFWRLVGFRV